MKPEQYIAEQVKAELALSEQKTEEAKFFCQRVFYGIGIFLSFAGAVIAIYATDQFRLAAIILLWGGLDIIFWQRFFGYRKQ